jgi:dihydrofolate reductase
MQKIIYYVASSLDGYIAGPEDDISLFAFQGKGVEQYQADLAKFKTVIMGRRTYEFGYQYGLKPGHPAYPHMDHHIFSDTLKFDEQSDKVHIEPRSVERVRAIQRAASTDVYLCGGGQFAGWLLDHGLIDQLKLKLNPIILGAGIPLFGASKTAARWQLTDRQIYDDGLQILTYDIKR